MKTKRNLAAMLILLFAASAVLASPEHPLQGVYVSGFLVHADPCEKQTHVIVDIANGNRDPVDLLGGAVELVDNRCPIQKVPVGLTAIRQSVGPCATVSVDLQWGGLSFDEIVLIDRFGNRIGTEVPAGVDWDSNTIAKKEGCGGWTVESMRSCEHGCVQCVPCRAGSI